MKQPSAEGLVKFKGLIERYHSTLDLTSIRALGSVDRLIEDAQRYARLLASLSPVPRVILDLGSGVGLPGIPVAIALPGCRLILVERRRRRSTFLRIVASQLSLDNVEIVAGDVRDISGLQVGAVTAQAVGSLTQVYALTRHLHGEQLWLVSRKGQEWRAELDDLEAEHGSAVAEVRTEELEPHGTLIAALVPGGLVCPR